MCTSRPRLSSTRYKRPESVLVVVHTGAGDVLLLQRRKPADYWQSVTGSLKYNESPAAAAQREVQEETGLQLPVIDCHRINRFSIHPAWRDRYAPDVQENTEHVFRAELVACHEVTLNPAEHRLYRWLPAQEAALLASSVTNRDAIRDFVAIPA